METYKLLKFHYGVEANNLNAKVYNSKDAAENAGKSWQNDCTVHAEIRKARNFRLEKL